MWAYIILITKAPIFEAILALRYRKTILNDDVTHYLGHLYDIVALGYLRKSGPRRGFS